eukprot:TRINITY_DN33910_c0_g1_i1.p1 TRINITY_DN33910_c0_g1~~TRINITY_DN33910_c0_g1_i1.p1  ORF type:complete len:571 (+),score=107.99 TRINITY_DN33910_c0_g1_i1:46-1758(+)
MDPAGFDHAAAFSELKSLMREQEVKVAQGFKKLEARLDMLGGDQQLDQLLTDSVAPEADGALSPKRLELRQTFRKSKSKEEEQLKETATNHARVTEVASAKTLNRANKPFLSAVVEHPAFEIFFGFVIVSNALVLGLEVSATAKGEADSLGPAFLVATVFYAFLFTAELVLRLLVYGRYFLYMEGWQWNWLDLVIVACSLWEVCVEFSHLVPVEMESVSGLAAIRVVRIIRITRMVRIIKVARLIRFVKALRTLVSSITHTIKSLFWALVLLVLLVYVFGILFTQAVYDHLSDIEVSAEASTSIESYWSGLLTSMLTLFMAITGGVSWELPLAPLSEIHGVWVAIFLFYIAFAYLAVLNVVTGVFCEAAIESARSDHEMAMHSIMENRKAHVAKVKSLFEDLDEDGSGTLTLDELEHHMNSDIVKDYFEMLELDVRDAWSLFRLLDQDGGSEVELEEFLWGCMHLRGNAKALDLARLQYDHRWLLRQQTDFMAYSEEQFDKLMRLHSNTLNAVRSARIQSQSEGLQGESAAQPRIQSRSEGPQGELAAQPRVQPSSSMPLFTEHHRQRVL